MTLVPTISGNFAGPGETTGCPARAVSTLVSGPLDPRITNANTWLPRVTRYYSAPVNSIIYLSGPFRLSLSPILILL